MKRFLLPLPLVCGSVLAAPAAGTAGASAPKHVPLISSETPGSAAKVIPYGPQDVVGVKTKIRYMTLIVLPKEERILDFTCGDKDWWVVSGTENFAYVKPAKAGAQTNLNLVTAAGNVYSFLLTGVSEHPNAEAD